MSPNVYVNQVIMARDVSIAYMQHVQRIFAQMEEDVCIISRIKLLTVFVERVREISSL